MINFLQEGQSIVYFRNGAQISELTSSILRNSKTPLSIAQYLRHYQPFTKEGCALIIPYDGGEKTQRTSIVAKVVQEGNTLIVTTKNSEYKIEYRGIDLTRILADGHEGCNKSSDGVTPAMFPSIQPVAEAAV